MWAALYPLRASEDPSAPTAVATSVDTPDAAGTDDAMFPSFAGAFVTVPPRPLILFNSPVYPDLLARFATCVQRSTSAAAHALLLRRGMLLRDQVVVKPCLCNEYFSVIN